MADVQITVVDQQDVQMAVVDQNDTQIALTPALDAQLALAAPAEAQIIAAAPTFQGAVVESIDDLSDVDTATVAPSGGQTLLWDSASSTWKPGTVATAAQGALADTALQPASSVDNLSDVDINAEHTTPLDDGRALIYVNGKWQAGPVIGGYSYNTSNDDLAASVRFGSSFDTNFLDETGYWDQVTKILTVTTFGSTAISTSQKKYGTASLYLPSSSYLTYTSSTNASAFTLGTSDFCIEFWAYNTASSGARGLLYYAHSSGGSINFTIVNANILSITAGSIQLFATASWASGWNHIAFVRDAGVFKLYQNGVQQATSSTSINFTTFQEFRLGWANPASPYYLNGYIDDLRITIGAARYTSNFTPPTSAILGENVVSEYSIENLSDVDVTTVAPAEGQALVWASGTSQWEPSTSALSDYLLVSSLKTVVADSTDFADFQSRIAGL